MNVLCLEHSSKKEGGWKKSAWTAEAKVCLPSLLSSQDEMDGSVGKGRVVDSLGLSKALDTESHNVLHASADAKVWMGGSQAGQHQWEGSAEGCGQWDVLYQEAAEGTVLGSVPCHVFMHDLKLAVKCLPVMFPEDPKLGRPVWLPAEGLGWAGGMGSRSLTIQTLLWPHIAPTGEEAMPGAGHRPCPGQD